MSSDAIWAGLIGVCAAFEAYAIANHQDGDTLSERLRAWFRTDTRTGKIVFTVAWLALTAWFVPHIVFGG